MENREKSLPAPITQSDAESEGNLLSGEDLTDAVFIITYSFVHVPISPSYFHDYQTKQYSFGADNKRFLRYAAPDRSRDKIVPMISSLSRRNRCR